MSAPETLVQVLLAHETTLGAACTCGESLPEGRLDTRRWRAEHVAEQVVTYLEQRSVEVNP